MTQRRDSARQAWLRETLDQYERPLVRYAQRLTGNLETARDVVQDAFSRLCSQDRADVDGHVAEWLFTVCRRRALDVRRKENRMSAMPEAFRDAAASGDPPPPVVLELEEAASRMLRILQALPENQQEVIRLKFQGGLRYKEIAGVTGLSVGNVGFLMHTGMKAIRERLREIDGETEPGVIKMERRAR